MKKILLLIVAIVLNITAFSTSQYPDKIIYNGKEFRLEYNPLEVFFKKNPTLKPEIKVISSALWRGYVATFEVIDNQLYVKDIQIEESDTTDKDNYKTYWKSVMNQVFPNQTRVKVDWVNGLIVLPYGEVVEYIHMGYGSLHENYILLVMENGMVKKEIKLNAKEYQAYTDRQFQAFKKTKEYKKMVKELNGKSSEFKMSEEEMDMFLKSYLNDYKSIILKD